MLRFSWWLHRTLLRLSGGRIAPRVNGFDVLLLTTRGRRSGAMRTAALQYLEKDGAYVVIGSNAGDSHHPAWWLNLVTEPEATVTIRARATRVHAHEAMGGERQALWDRFVAIDDAYAEYERRVERRIPVVVLEPTR